MKIGLHDADREHIKNKKFPNYALMKIAAYERQQGNEVEWWIPILNQTYDKVYSSKIFDFTPENPDIPEHTIKGGTGYNIKAVLPDKIEKMSPDYNIYPDCDYAIGFLTRGCPNKCRWCVVPEKEGNIKPYRMWQQVIRADTNKLVLMDNNILASEYGIEQLRSLADTNIHIDLNQGMDIRLVTEDIVDAEYRVQALKGIYRNINIYAQAERNEGKGIIPNDEQLEFAQRYVYGRAYKKETWKEYCKIRNLPY